MINKINVLAISGSIRKEAIALKLIKAFDKYSPSNIDLNLADISKLPIYNQDLELPEPEFLLNWKKQIKQANAILIVTPEYNRSIPPVLKNALDWASRPQVKSYDQRTWNEKPTGIIGYSAYSLGGFGVVHHLRQVLSFLNMPTMQQPEFYLTFAGEKFDKDNNLIDQNTKEHIEKFWEAFIRFIDRWNK